MMIAERAYTCVEMHITAQQVYTADLGASAVVQCIGLNAALSSSCILSNATCDLPLWVQLMLSYTYSLLWCKRCRLSATACSRMHECIHVLWKHANVREACFVTTTVYHVCACSFKGVDIALFSAGGSISKKLGPIASDAGCTVRPLACITQLQECHFQLFSCSFPCLEILLCCISCDPPSNYPESCSVHIIMTEHKHGIITAWHNQHDHSMATVCPQHGHSMSTA